MLPYRTQFALLLGLSVMTFSTGCSWLNQVRQSRQHRSHQEYPAGTHYQNYGGQNYGGEHTTQPSHQYSPDVYSNPTPAENYEMEPQKTPSGTVPLNIPMPTAPSRPMGEPRVLPKKAPVVAPMAPPAAPMLPEPDLSPSASNFPAPTLQLTSEYQGIPTSHQNVENLQTSYQTVSASTISFADDASGMNPQDPKIEMWPHSPQHRSVSTYGTGNSPGLMLIP